MLKIGVVGVGHMGRYHINTLSTISNIQFTAICDNDQQMLDQLSERYNVKAYTDYHKFLKKVDAVIIALPTYLHYKFASDALEYGKHVLLEKPVTKTVYFAEKLLNLAMQKNLVLQIGHVERFNAAVQELKKVVKKPRLIQAQRLGPLNRVKDMGVVLDLMIHDIDIVFGIAGSEMLDIEAHGQKIHTNFEDVANASIYFENGAIANITASRVSSNKLRSLAISQDDAYLFLDYSTQDLMIYRQPMSEYFVEKQEIKYKQESMVERVFVHKDNALKLEQLHFVDCIENEIEPLRHPEDAIKALKTAKIITEKIYMNWKKGKQI